MKSKQFFCAAAASATAVCVVASMMMPAQAMSPADHPGFVADVSESQDDTAGLAGDSLSLSLDDVFRIIGQDNRTMQMLRTAVEAAEEGVKDAKSALYPDLDASVSASYIGDAFLSDRDFSNFTRAETPHFGNTFSVDARQVLYAGGVIKAGIDLAKYGLERSNAELEKTGQGLRLMAAGQYLDLYRIGNGIRVYKENIALTERLIEDVRAKREQGLALADDVTRYELQLQNLSLALLSLVNTAEVMNYRLCESLGLNEGTVISPYLPSHSGGRYSTLADWQEAALENAPDARLAEIGRSEAEAQRRIVRGAMLPKISIVAHDDITGPITYEVPPINKNINVWYVGIGISYSFSSLWKSGSRLRQAGLSARAAGQALDVAHETLRNEVKQAYTDYLQSFTELETRRKSLQLATENYDRVHYRYMEQLALVTDMLDAFTVKLDAEIGVADAEAEIQYRLCRLKYAAGLL